MCSSARSQLGRPLVVAGSASRLVMQALSDETASPEELAEIRQLLDKLEQERS